MLPLLQDEHASQQALARLAWCAEQYGGPLLLVIDNAEEAASGQNSQQFLDYVKQVKSCIGCPKLVEVCELCE